MQVPPFHLIYRAMLAEVLDGENSVLEKNERTDRHIRVARGALAFGVDLSDGLLPVCGVRKLFPRTAAAEVAWFLGGHRNASFLSSRGFKLWDKFAEEGGKVDSAYGYRWRRHFGRDQIDRAITTLASDPTDRRVVVSAWDPGRDGLGNPSKAVPCPVMFTLSIVDNRLCSTLLLRSSDMFVGLPYDTMGHSLLMSAIACSIRNTSLHPRSQHLGLGLTTIVLAHAHIYDSHFADVQKALSVTPVGPGPRLPMQWPVGSIDANPDRYIEMVGDLSRQVEWPEFNPRPEVVQ